MPDADSSSGQVPLVVDRRQPWCWWQTVRHHPPHQARSSRCSGLRRGWAAFRCSSWIYTINFVDVNELLIFIMGKRLPIFDIHPRTSKNI